MIRIKFSKNKKTNKVLNKIYLSLLHISDNVEESKKEIKRYKKHYKNAAGITICEHARVLFANYDIRQLYKEYKSLKNASDAKIWSIYTAQVNYICYNYFD